MANPMANAMFNRGKYNFREALGRLQQAFRALTQDQIAKTIGVSKGSVNGCIQRQVMPDSWLISLYFRYHLNPHWVLWGEEHKMFLIPSDSAPTAEAWNGEDCCAKG